MIEASPPAVPPTSLSRAAGSSPRWLDLATAAQLSGKSEGHLRRLCGDRWLAEGKARLNQAPGVKPFWEVRSDADPALVLDTAAVGPSIDIRKYPKPLVDEAMRKAAILDRWRRHLVAAATMRLTRNEATDGFLVILAREGIELSRPSLYGWEKKFREGGGVVGLIDQRAAKSVHQEENGSGKNDLFLDEVKSLWLTQQRPSVSMCWKMALVRAAKMGWTVRSYRQTARFIEDLQQSEKATVLKLRHGDEAFKNEAQTFIQRDYSTLESNEIWNADHHQFDVLVQTGTRTNAGTGEVLPVFSRPWLTAWQDLRSRKIVGWVIRAQDPNTDVILEALRRGCLNHGVPRRVYTDNGKDFDSQSLTGETKAMRWKRRKVHVEHDVGRLSGVYAALQVEHIHAWPYHGQSKPIERFFGTLEGSWGKTFDTYCGRNAQERPEQLPAMLERGKAPSFEEFVEKFATWIEVGYHQQPHAGDSMDGERPSVVWEQNLRTKRTAQEGVLELLLQPRIGPLKISQNGLVHKGIWYGQYDLGQWLGHEVYISFPNRKVNQVSVWAGGGDGRFLCVARANLRVAANATTEHLAQAISEQKKENRVRRQAAQLKPRMHMDRTDRLNEAAAASSAQHAPAPAIDPNGGGPSISPIRSDVEGQLPAIRNGFQMPLKKAVGDDTALPGGFEYRSTESPGEEDSAPGFIYHGGTEDRYE